MRPSVSCCNLHWCAHVKLETMDKKSISLFFMIFVLAFIPRGLDLGIFPIVHEQIWIGRSLKFMAALLNLDFKETWISSHPGVFPMWLGGISLGFSKFMFGYKREMTDLLFWGQMPFAIISSLFIASLYFILKNIFNNEIAILSCVLISFDPFLIALSRIIHLDAELTLFMSLSVLTFLLFLQKIDNKFMLAISGVCCGLALMTKQPAIALYPFVGFVIAIIWTNNCLGTKSFDDRFLKTHLKNYSYWCLISLIAMYVIWPAMWLDPTVLIKLFAGAPGSISVVHESGQFFMGKPVKDPGFMYYFFVTLFRMTPVTMVAFFLCLFWLLTKGLFFRHRLGSIEKNTAYLLLFIVFFYIFMSIPAKKLGRYMLPVFPIIEIVAAIGLYVFITSICKTLFVEKKKYVYAGIVFLLLVTQGFNAYSVHPYYSSYYNPLIGGFNSAANVIQVGRGEGMGLVANYLNQKPNAEKLIVGCDFSYMLKGYFKGKRLSTMISKYDPDILQKIDYLVVNISAIQKEGLRIPIEVLDYHYSHTPEHIVSINGNNYAYIYKL